MKLSVLVNRFGICRLPARAPLPPWVDRGSLFSVVRAEDELSILCPESRIPVGVSAERGFRALRVHGPFAFSEVGILSALTGILAEARLAILAVSTFDTDYLFVKEESLEAAMDQLEQAGHHVLRDLAVPRERSVFESEGVEIRSMLAEHWDAVLEIYRQGIETGQATLETRVPERDEWDRRHAEPCRLVAVESAGVVGWAALNPVSTREVYAGVAEVSVYVGSRGRGRGLGRLLLAALVAASEDAGFWTLQAAVFPENEASVRLHRACGFRDVGVRERLGRRLGEWRDVLVLERRSARVGT